MPTGMNNCWKCGAAQPTTFAELVKNWIAERPLREASAGTGISAATLSRVANGELPDLRTFAALVAAIKVDASFALSLIPFPVVKESPVEPAA